MNDAERAPSRRNFRHSVLRGVDGSRGSRYASNTHEIRSESMVRSLHQ